MAEEESELEIRRTFDVQQSMIDISADRLEGLRTQCATSAELTQHEIRTLEGKLIKLFAKQLLAKAKLRDLYGSTDLKYMPSVQQWLQVVGISPSTVQAICSKVKSLESLQEKSDHELRQYYGADHAMRNEEHRRLTHALHNLKRYTEILTGSWDEAGGEESVALYWDSWDRREGSEGGSPRTRLGRSSIPSEESLLVVPLTPPYYSPTPPLVMPSTPPIYKPSRIIDKGKFSSTPPLTKKHHHHELVTSAIVLDSHPLIKSKSHESQLANKVDGENNNTTSGIGGENGSSGGSGCSGTPIVGVFVGPRRRPRLATEPGPGCTSPPSLSSSSPIKSPQSTVSDHSDSGRSTTSSNVCLLQVPKSPRTPTISRGMGHVIAHRFTKTFKMMTTCDYCDKQMFIGTGLKCKECKYKCHRDCESKVPPSCGLPRELVDEFKKSLAPDGSGIIPTSTTNQSPSLTRPSPSHHVPSSNVTRSHRDRKPTMNVPPFPGGPDSSSNTSSCNSSTPSSPALVMSQQCATPPAGISSGGGIGSSARHLFNFPDVVTLDTHPLIIGGSINSEASTDRTSAYGTQMSSSADSNPGDRTPLRVDSQDSQVSDSDMADRAWPRQNSLSMREWDIPFDELKIGEPLGTGHFGTVYRGNWHGDVAIKVLNMSCLDDEKALEAFKFDVATFRKTRHENLVLFMGACMKPPRLAIVTSMCKGYSLYMHIHVYKDKFNMNKTISMAQQITQGMGYLHARGIVHKDLKTKNIFMDNGKVIITDFGLFSVTKLCFRNSRCDGLSIPPGWLCYIAPEIVRSLKAYQKPDEELPFSQASDIYAFGTVWYELLCGEWPYKGQPPEAIIWQVGKGMKQTLANLQASRDVKDILMMCWSFRANDRPDFLYLQKTLEKLPKKRLARSPSHPIHLSRSAESVF